jgi:hypothetical protein
MPLSDDEEKILAEIEANIRQSDPHLAQHVEQTTVYRHSGKRIVGSIIVIIVLLGIIVATFTNLWPVAFAAFGAMVIVGIALVDHIVKIGRAGVDEARKQAKKMNNTSSWRTRGDR